MEEILQDLNPQKSKTAYDKAWADFVQHCGVVNQPQNILLFFTDFRKSVKKSRTFFH